MYSNTDTVETARDLIRNFLRRSGVKKQPIAMFDSDRVVEKIVRERLPPLDIAPDRFEKQLRSALAIGTTAYAHMHIDIQAHITIYSVFALCIDDFDLPFDAVEEFVMRFVSGQPQLSPGCEVLADNLRHMTDYYPPRTASGIVTSTLDFINSTVFEKAAEHFGISDGADNYAVYTRLKNGVSQAYGLFIWDKFNFPEFFSYAQYLPDTRVCINYVNDILSFYKEELAGDFKNVVHSRATARREMVTVVLSDMVDEVIASMDACRAHLGEKEREAWECFMSGYLTFHYLAPRYRLREVISL